MTEKPEQLFSQEAEESVIGSVLINPGCFTGINLTAGQFYVRRLGYVWQACRPLENQDVGIDLVTICEELDRMGKLAEVGGVAYLIGLINATPSSYSAGDYARIVADHARRRVWRDLANRVAKAAFDFGAELEQVAPEIVDELLSAVQSPGAAVHAGVFARQVLEEAIERNASPRDVWGIPTGFVDFDHITGGLQPGEILNVSGDPGVGKSIFVSQGCHQMAICGRPGVLYSLEMPGKQVMRRRISHMARLMTRQIKSGRFDPTRIADIERAVREIEAVPLYMSDSPQWTTMSLRADLTRMKAQHGIEWFGLDYAYLLQDGRGMTENDRTGVISAQLKSICRGLDVAGVVILSQNKTGMREAQKSGVELRGNGQQFYDADLILFLTEEKAIAPGEKSNVVVATFGKGRELENSKEGFRLTKSLIGSEGLPAFENYVADKREPGRYS